ncbi:MAG: GlcNAc-PI de-N-acetylase [Chloroflexi bacterium]|nr:GlcNAc-PI de-N-acetylase [Chloroflexota bacterium]
MSEEQSQKNVAMVVMAHPDDAEFSSAGTVAGWVRQGWEVYYVIVADGAAGGPDDATEVGPEQRKLWAEIRKEEQLAAAKVLGVKEVIFLNYPDGQVEPSMALRRDLVRCLRRYKPLRVICQSPERAWVPQMFLGRYHPDHLAAGVATLAAIYPASQNPWDFPELLQEGLLPHKVLEVYISGSPNPNFPVDITETVDLKIEALRAHTTQTGPDFEGMETRIRSMLAQTGEKYKLGAAEIFHRVENGGLPAPKPDK